ncbi:MAG TPA: class I SAM-dependent methyltransferase [Acidisarcina sp.]
MACRNCGATDVRDLGFIGALAPFFLKRVFRAEVAEHRSISPVKRALQALSRPAGKIFSRIYRPVVVVQMQSCQRCSFVQTTHPFEDQAIGRLYEDYRSGSYNEERIHYEPAYAAVAGKVGGHDEGGLGRVAALTAWLQSRVDLKGEAMLDYGGADGRYLPDLPGKRFVYEISDIEPAPGVVRISSEANLGTYAYVQLSHVLEHVTHPLEMVRQVAALLQKDGYLLVEVPQDVKTETLARLQAGDRSRNITLHEHINLYSAMAVAKLLEAAGLEVIAVDTVPVQTPIQRQDFIRALGRSDGRGKQGPAHETQGSAGQF